MHLGENFAVEVLDKENPYVIDFDNLSAPTNRPEYDLCGSRRTLFIRVPRLTFAILKDALTGCNVTYNVL